LRFFDAAYPIRRFAITNARQRAQPRESVRIFTASITRCQQVARALL
jgi:hypothetical protein